MLPTLMMRKLLDLRELFTTGLVASIGPGATNREVEAALGPPDAIAELDVAIIWLYAGVELTFIDGGELSGVFSDHLPLDEDDSAIELRPWFLGSDVERALTNVSRELERAGVGFHRRPRDPRWSDPVPDGERIPIAVWSGERWNLRVFAELELACGVSLSVGCFADTLADGREVFSEDIIVAFVRGWPSREPAAMV